jgi:hypothetical protein
MNFCAPDPHLIPHLIIATTFCEQYKLRRPSLWTFLHPLLTYSVLHQDILNTLWANTINTSLMAKGEMPYHLNNR